MTNKIHIAIAAFLMLFGVSNAFAQDYVAPEVTISSEKVRVDGQLYYSHIVLERQTLYSIAKAYGVTIEEIYQMNPAVKESGLKKNAVILIPIAKPQEKEVAVAQEKNSDKEEKSAGKEEKGQVRMHTVKWYENLESIAADYGVTVEQIMSANNLKTKKLSSRQKLIIPEPQKVTENKQAETGNKQAEVENEETEHEVEYVQPASESETAGREIAEEDMAPVTDFASKEKVEITLLLPLKADGNSCSHNNMDFYCGALLAAKDLSENGISSDIRIYDIADGNIPVTRSRLEASDIIIGPVSSGDITRLKEVGCMDKYIISPLDPRAEALARSREGIIQVPTSHDVQHQELVRWIESEVGSKDAVVMISEKGARQSESISQLKAAVGNSTLPVRNFSYSILEGRSVLEPLERLLNQEGRNRIIIASESEAFVNDVIRNVNLLIHNKFDIVLYGPAKIRNFETIEVENLHNGNLHICTSYNIDYNNERVRDFIYRYRALFRAEPTQYAFQGYDIIYYFATLCAKFGENWERMLTVSEKDMLQSNFNFVRTESGSYTNKGVRKVEYEKNWKVRTVK